MPAIPPAHPPAHPQASTAANPLEPGLAVPDDANALAPGVWPATADRDGAGRLVVGGIDAGRLAAEFGTPLYVVDEADARGRAERIRRAFEAAASSVGTTCAVYYAGKAFLTITVARWMADAGLRFDVASGGELAVVLAAGADPARIGVHGNNKSVAEIDRAVAAGVGNLVVDSRVEVDRIADAAERHGVVQAVRLRVNSGVHASTHEYLATAREDQKFGVPLADVPALVAAIRARPSLDFLGLHSHIGSQIFDTAGFDEAARRLLAVHAALLADGPVPELNLGGGFGIAYTAADEVPPIERIATSLVDAVAARCAELGIEVPALAVEPGRWIIGPAGVTLYEVGTVKDVEVAVDGPAVGASGVAGGDPAPGPRTAVRRYVSVDGGMSDNIRPSLYGADYTVRIASRTSTAAPALVRVAGKHCESGDVVVHADHLPGDVAPGDLLAVPATGAYCWSLANNYNHLGRPAVVAVRDAGASLLVRRETEEDLLARDAAWRPDEAREDAR